jgi:hypothetical protein
MILRAIEELSLDPNADPRPIWDVIFEHQSNLNGAKQCWLITQPSHSALSGEMAARLLPQVFGKFDEAVVRAIALHDAGWSAFDSELIRASRLPAGKTNVATSFLGTPPKDATAAWTASVETALQASPLGGLLVSEHFRSLAQFQVAQFKVNENPGNATDMAAFARQEEARQKKLRTNLGLDPATTEGMVEGLRFCDLLSLYVCMGITQPVELPQQFQQHRFSLHSGAQGEYILHPFPFSADQAYSFAALRHPRTKEVSSATFLVRVHKQDPSER